jgi:hypothetical protein
MFHPLNDIELALRKFVLQCRGLAIFSFSYTIETLKQCEKALLPARGMLFALMPIEPLDSL